MRMLIAVLFFAVSSFSISCLASASSDEGATTATLSVRTSDIWRTLDRAAWVAERDPAVKPNGKVLYAITFRSCPTCAAFKAAEHDALLQAGVEIRWIVYARRDREGKPRSKTGERAVVAELWLTRDPGLMARWWQADDLDAFYSRPDLPALADGDPQREAALARSRALVDQMSGLLADNDLDMAIPALIWREGPKTKAFIGYSADGFAQARAFLTAPAH
jgi:hypothetical protein